MRFALPLALLLLAGCASPAPIQTLPATADEGTQPLAMTTLEMHREGVLTYRLSGEGVPWQMYTGDAPGFCFVMPTGAAHFEATLSWNDPRPLTMELSGRNSHYRSWGDKPETSLQHTSPLTMSVEDPEDGTWQAWVGPIFADAQRAWVLDLTWVVPAPATLEDLTYTGDAICD